jgi:hypothetical protein
MKDMFSYIASTIIGITAIVILIQGAVTDNFDNVIVGMFLAVITVIIATATAIKNQLLKELKK